MLAWKVKMKNNDFYIPKQKLMSTFCGQWDNLVEDPPIPWFISNFDASSANNTEKTKPEL